MTPVALVRLCETVDGDRAAMILRTLDGARELTVLVPRSEADRLGRVAGMAPCACVPIYSLVAAVVAHFAAAIDHTIVDDHQGRITARLVLRHAGATWALACHPADAVALAKREAVPIVATPAAMRHAAAVAPAPGDVGAWLERVRPGDFGV